MRPAHFLNLRWRQDYRFVTELRGRGVGPLEQAGLRLQQTKPDAWALYSETLPGVGDIITLFGRMFLVFDGRRAVWQHSLVYPPGARDDVTARAIFRAAYGGDPGLLLPTLYELLAPLEHWQGDPLVRRMFLGAPATAPEPVAATLIRELWGEHFSLGEELLAKIDALERSLSEVRGPGCLDEPTEEELLNPLEMQPALQRPEQELPSAQRDWHRLDPRWAMDVLVNPSEGNTSGGLSHERVDVGVESALDLSSVRSDLDATRASMEENGERSVGTPFADEARETLHATGLSAPDPRASDARDEQSEGAPHAVALGDEAREAPASLGLRNSDIISPDVHEEPTARGLSSEPLVLASARLFDLPTEEIPLGSIGRSHRPAEPSDEEPAHPPARSGDGQMDESALVSVVGVLNPGAGEEEDEDDEDDEDDRKTVIERSGGIASHGPWLNSAPTQIFPRALNSSPTLIHIPRATAADRMPPPAVAKSSEHTPLEDAPLEAHEVDNHRGRSMVIAASLGLLAALLALWIIWNRSTTVQELPRGDEQALEASGPSPVPVSDPPSAPKEPSPAVRSDGGEVTPKTEQSVACYRDDDHDGYWAKGAKPTLQVGEKCPRGKVEENEDNSGKFDCDDLKPGDNPGARERCDGHDNDCDREVFLGDQDDDKNGELDCLQRDFGRMHMRVSASPVGGPGNPNYSLEIKVRLPEAAAQGATCTPYLIVENKGSGKMTGTLKRGDGEWTCHVPIGDSTPLGNRCFSKGKRLVAAGEEVDYTVECCFFNENSYDTYKLNGYKDPEKYLTCGFWSSGSQTTKY